MRICDYTVDLKGSIWSLNASIVSVHDPPAWFHFESPQFPNFYFDADPDPALTLMLISDMDPAFHSNADPDPAS